MNDINNYDKNFDEDKFLARARNIYVMLCSCLTTEKFDRVKHFISDEVLTKYENILSNLQTHNERQMYDELNIKSITINSYEIKDEKIYIYVNLISKYLDYVIDKNSAKIVRGNNNSRTEKYNTLIFVKKINTRELGIVSKCPTCGNSMNINYSGKCDFCGTIFNMEDYDYILADIN